MNRRKCLGLITISAFGAVLTPATAWSQDFEKLSLEEYEKRLNAILRTRLDAEKEFVKKVVQLVREEKLPRKLVDTSFKWVRNRRPDTNYPFVYFERVLRLQAKRLKYDIPPFDYDVYRAGRSRGRR